MGGVVGWSWIRYFVHRYGHIYYSYVPPPTILRSFTKDESFKFLPAPKKKKKPSLPFQNPTMRSTAKVLNESQIRGEGGGSLHLRELRRSYYNYSRFYYRFTITYRNIPIAPPSSIAVGALTLNHATATYAVAVMATSQGSVPNGNPCCMAAVKYPICHNL